MKSNRCLVLEVFVNIYRTIELKVEDEANNGDNGPIFTYMDHGELWGLLDIHYDTDPYDPVAEFTKKKLSLKRHMVNIPP